MHRVAYLVLGSCLFMTLSLFAGPLEAGEYPGRYVWYSGSCCYQKIVRHERDVRYVPLGGHAAPYGAPRVHVRRPQPHCVVQQAAFRYAYYPNGPRC